MPVRIYDIAKKLGLESKEVLAKAKELGIASARVASSSLDKITAEYLESHFTPAKPAAPPAAHPAPPEPIVIVSAPPPAAPVAPVTSTESISEEVRTEVPGAVVPPAAPSVEVPEVVEMRPAAPVEEVTPPVAESPAEPAPAEPVAEAEPPTPAGPKVGDLVGR